MSIFKAFKNSQGIQDDAGSSHEGNVRNVAPAEEVCDFVIHDSGTQS